MSEKIKTVMASVFDVDLPEIDDNCSADTLEKWDSLKHINLITALEEEFGVSFSNEDISNMVNYKLIHLTLQEKLK
ncbi:MAG: acyl carrier protein [Elusimicrobia bacterium]|nr:acyl carrier protein [Elusimicrobiota bacterium]